MSEKTIDGESRSSIRSYFGGLGKQIFKPREISQLVTSHRGAWGVPQSCSAEDVMTAVAEETGLQMVKFSFPSRPESRYLLGDLSVYEVILSLRPNCYFTHSTALYLNGLSESEPTVIYVNSEQSPKPRWDSSLSQEGIDRAFKRPPRITNNTAQFREYTVFLLSGKNTGNLGVVSSEFQGSALRVTNVERTLIDVTVRPSYAGEITDVLRAYQCAKDKMSTEVLSDTLRRLDHLYPYHQSIGFLLEKAGVFTDAEIEPIRQLPREFDCQGAR